MVSLKSTREGEYWVKNSSANISFNFCQDRSLNISEFFEAFFLHLKKSSESNARILAIHMTGFSNTSSPEHFEKEDVHGSFKQGKKLLDLFLSIKIPIISLIKKHVCGPLLEPILFSDFVIAAKGARISSLFIEKGYYPRMGMLSRLLEIFDKKKFVEFLLNGLVLTTDAKNIFPLLYQVVEEGKENLDDFLKLLLRKGNYPMILIKELSKHAKILPPREAYIMERYNFALCFSDIQFKEKIESFFKERS